MATLKMDKNLPIDEFNLRIFTQILTVKSV